MITFKHTKDAYNENDKCPICDSILFPDKDIFEIKWGKYNDYFLFNKKESKLIQASFEVNASSKASYFGFDKKDISILDLIDCESCFQYSREYRLFTNITNYDIYDILFMEESITYDVADSVYEIHNDYLRKKTIYCTTSIDESQKITLPLISENLLNPTKIVDRIKSLIIYT